MAFFSKLIGFFSKYVHPHEKKVDKFFNSINSGSNSLVVKEKLLLLMQENLAVLTVWMEKKYKGYRFLTKRVRKRLYVNLDKVLSEFNDFPNSRQDKECLDSYDLNPENREKLAYILTIMGFLKPGGRYKYLESSGFFRLLVDPNETQMSADCNQIVTFYAFLYALRYPLKDLEIKLLPGHVCLHFKGIDIEATSATLEKYEEFTHILPITEIVSTNMLDITDVREETYKIDPRVFVKSAQLAFQISSLHDLVSKNLDAAYHNLAISSMNSGDYEGAVFFADKTGDGDFKKLVYKNCALYYQKAHDFKKAVYFARKVSDNVFLDNIYYNEGIYYFNSKKFEKAISIFQNLNNAKMLKECYKGQFVQLQKTLSDRVDKNYVRAHRMKFQKMLELARKFDDGQIVADLQKMLEY